MIITVSPRIEAELRAMRDLFCETDNDIPCLGYGKDGRDGWACLNDPNIPFQQFPEDILKRELHLDYRGKIIVNVAGYAGID